MDSSTPTPRTTGPAFRVIVLFPETPAVYERVFVQLDGEYGMVHVFSEDGQTHHLSIPAPAAIVEWEDASALRPHPFIPSFVPGAWEEMGAQMQQMMEGMGRAFGPS